jgi:hypothetical protein
MPLSSNSCYALVVLITDGYKELNQRLHEQRADYGVSGQKYAPRVLELSQVLSTRDILDYGCGKRTLEKALGFEIRNYDPCIPGLDDPPAPAQLVVCTDVLEHIEPECLDDVLDDLRRCTTHSGFFAIATRPAKKFLADGRNAHLIQQDARWWLDRLWARFRISDFRDIGSEFHVVVHFQTTT